MPPYLEIVNKVLSLGTIFLQVVIVIIVINLIFFRRKTNFISVFFKEYTFILGFLIALGAFFCSLFYSNVVGYPPCELCWIERIFLYPQLILFGVALYKKDKSIVDYSIAFAVLGSLVSLYHVYVENGGLNVLSCANPSVTEVSCAIRYIYEFGYITMPLMALTLSIFIIVILMNYKYTSNN